MYRIILILGLLVVLYFLFRRAFRGFKGQGKPDFLPPGKNHAAGSRLQGICSKGNGDNRRYWGADVLLLQPIVRAQVPGTACGLTARVTRVGEFFFFVEFERDLALIG
jgi:hypothetical protein